MDALTDSTIFALRSTRGLLDADFSRLCSRALWGTDGQKRYARRKLADMLAAEAL
jgi:hypothetical protein